MKNEGKNRPGELTGFVSGVAGMDAGDGNASSIDSDDTSEGDNSTGSLLGGFISAER